MVLDGTIVFLGSEKSFCLFIGHSATSSCVSEIMTDPVIDNDATSSIIDADFTTALPKTELHAHLSGSISRETLSSIWQTKKSQGDDGALALGDPAIALKPSGSFPTILSFFQIFNEYIYNLVNDRESIVNATNSVAEDFRRDGVRYLELRTTPREIPTAGISREDYVKVVLDALEQYRNDQANIADGNRIEIQLILSIDRTMTPSQAHEIVDIASKYTSRANAPSTAIPPPSVVALDLCGNPTKGDVSTFTSTFLRAKAFGLKLTVHFAEVPASSTEEELRTLLSWQLDRLGHAIHIPAHFKDVIKKQKLGLELCLSCNVLAEMTQGGFKGHHFGEWAATECPVALSTDDVGVFESSLSNEYLIASREFGLGRNEVVQLAKKAVAAAFAGRERMERLIRDFERVEQIPSSL